LPPLKGWLGVLLSLPVAFAVVVTLTGDVLALLVLLVPPGTRFV
jgi:hypothetical protein